MAYMMMYWIYRNDKSSTVTYVLFIWNSQLNLTRFDNKNIALKVFLVTVAPVNVLNRNMFIYNSC